MDSLLLVLTVIGVILILAGVARMRSKRRHHRDVIDHSVLFDSQQHNSDELLDDDVVIVKKVRKVGPVDNEPVISTEHHLSDGESPLIKDSEEFRFDIDERDRPHPVREERPAVKERARSILSKLGMDDDIEERHESLDSDARRYRDNAPDKVIVLNIMAPRGQLFAGPALVDAIESLGLIYGEMEIFHLYSDNAPLFSLVNMVKPGIFDMATIETLNTPGVSIFIQLPNKQGNGLDAFDTMLNVSQRLNTMLGGSLCDERRNILTHSAIDYTRQQLAEYDCKWLTPA